MTTTRYTDNVMRLLHKLGIKSATKRLSYVYIVNGTGFMAYTIPNGIQYIHVSMTGGGGGGSGKMLAKIENVAP